MEPRLTVQLQGDDRQPTGSSPVGVVRRLDDNFVLDVDYTVAGKEKLFGRRGLREEPERREADRPLSFNETFQLQSSCVGYRPLANEKSAD